MTHTFESRAVQFELVELKSTGDKMEFSGFASTFGNRDHSNDVVMRTAFDATLQSDTKRRLLWQHDIQEPIGVEKELKVTDKGLFGTWKLSKTTRGLDAYELLKDGAVDSLSIGYIPTAYDFDDVGTRLLHAVDLLEISLVSIPANDQAVVTQVKAALAAMAAEHDHPLIKTDVPFGDLLKQIADGLGLGLKEAEALWARRLSEGREPTDAHIEAVKQLLAQVEAAAAGLTPLIAPEAKAQPNEAEAPEGDGESTPPPVEMLSDVSLRLANTRHRLLRAGILERAS